MQRLLYHISDRVVKTDMNSFGKICNRKFRFHCRKINFFSLGDQKWLVYAVKG